jgi:hypothetical protein
MVLVEELEHSLWYMTLLKARESWHFGDRGFWQVLISSDTKSWIIWRKYQRSLTLELHTIFAIFLVSKILFNILGVSSADTKVCFSVSCSTNLKVKTIFFSSFLPSPSVSFIRSSVSAQQHSFRLARIKFFYFIGVRNLNFISSRTQGISALCNNLCNSVTHCTGGIRRYMLAFSSTYTHICLVASFRTDSITK